MRKCAVKFTDADFSISLDEDDNKPVLSKFTIEELTVTKSDFNGNNMFGNLFLRGLLLSAVSTVIALLLLTLFRKLGPDSWYVNKLSGEELTDFYFKATACVFFFLLVMHILLSLFSLPKEDTVRFDIQGKQKLSVLVYSKDVESFEERLKKLIKG